jgi:predicted ester cyclase
MKNVLLFLGAALVIMACNSNDADGTSGSDSTNKQQSLIDAYKKIVKAIETGDSATLASLIPDDAVDHGASADGGDIKGKDIVRDLTEVHNDIDNLKMDVEQVAANDDHVFALVHMTGTTKENSIWGMPPKTKVDTRSIDVIKMKNGKATDHWTYVSPAEMMAAMQNGDLQPSVTDSVKH